MTETAPDGLGKDGLALWRDIKSRYTLRPDEGRVLEDAARTLDRIVLMRGELNSGPLMVKGSMGQPVVNPLVAEIRAHEAHEASLLARLKFKDDQAPANQARDAAQQRHAVMPAAWQHGRTA